MIDIQGSSLADHEGLPVSIQEPVKDLETRTQANRAKPSTLKRMLSYIPLTLAVIVDTVLAVPAFDLVLRESELLSWLCAIGASVLTVATAFLSGKTAKLELKKIAKLFGAAGLMTIISIFVLRVAAATLQISDTAGYAGGSGDSGEGSSELIIAFIMALVMIAGSIAAWCDGYLSTPAPKVTRFVISEIEVKGIEKEIGEHKEALSQLTDDCLYAEYQLDRIDEDLEVALKGVDAAILEFQGHARYEIARVLGNPVATSGLDLPIRPQNSDD
ncbi:MAG: hypothetical protein KF772_04765 [Cryobacterium sp.]|nr:hypothetical protein [Cryobacterium sp.]